MMTFAAAAVILHLLKYLLLASSIAATITLAIALLKNIRLLEWIGVGLLVATCWFGVWACVVMYLYLPVALYGLD